MNGEFPTRIDEPPTTLNGGRGEDVLPPLSMPILQGPTSIDITEALRATGVQQDAGQQDHQDRMGMYEPTRLTFIVPPNWTGQVVDENPNRVVLGFSNQNAASPASVAPRTLLSGLASITVPSPLGSIWFTEGTFGRLVQEAWFAFPDPAVAVLVVEVIMERNVYRSGGGTPRSLIGRLSALLRRLRGQR